MHHEAMKCVDKATDLLSHGDDDSLRYACLQLRMAIEKLFYEQIPLYAEELPLDIAEKWQPRAIIDALIDCDPNVELDTKNIVLYDEHPDGTRGNAVALGGQTAVSKKLLRDEYHKLGSKLHADVDGRPLDIGKLKSSIQKTVDNLNRFRGDRVMSNLAMKATIECHACQRIFKRNVEAIRQNPALPETRGVASSYQFPACCVQ